MAMSRRDLRVFLRPYCHGWDIMNDNPYGNWILGFKNKKDQFYPTCLSEAHFFSLPTVLWALDIALFRARKSLLGQAGRDLIWFLLCCCSRWHTLGARGQCHWELPTPPVLCMHLLSPEDSPTARTFPSSKIFTSFSAPQNPFFQYKFSVESQCIRLVPVSGSCLFINWRTLVVPLLFSSGIIKVYKQSILVAAGK